MMFFKLFSVAWKRWERRDVRMMPAGRPLKFQSVDELANKIDAYFESCYEEVEVTSGRGKNKVTRILKKRIKPFTVGGLATFLDCDRVTLLNYEDKDEEFFSTIKKAKQRIEADVEEGSLLGSYNPAASIFNLKNNFGWRDQSAIEHTGAGGGPIQHEGISRLTDAELEARIRELEGKK